ncbi:oligosaccharide flippase family protein [Polynucleobacter campilacus]|uniref:oligosaccharide flippase family protein n=1 Tax=Polynucleobacter campilacus TaxID=1743163 RepID=UPI0013747ACF|nr:oligosaccharide flippase family protein [Polynucleobacter campilacus]
MNKKITIFEGILRSYIISAVGLSIPLLISIISIPIIIRSLGLYEFGILSINLAVAGFIVLFDFGICKTFVNLSYRSKDNNKLTNKLFINSIYTLLILGFIFILIFLIIETISNLLSHGTNSVNFHIYIEILLISPIILISQFSKNYFESKFEFAKATMVQVINTSSMFIGPIVAIHCGFLDIKHIIISIGFFKFISIMISFILIANEKIKNELSFSVKIIKDLTINYKAMTINGISSPFLISADRVLLGLLSGPISVGTFSAASEFISRVFGGLGSITNILFPYYSAINSDNHKNGILFYKKTFYLYLLTCCVLFSILLIISDHINIYLFNESRDEKSIQVIYILIVGFFFNCVAQLPCSYIYATNKITLWSKVQIVEAIVYIPFLICMIEEKGLVGAAISLTIRLFIDLLLSIFISFKK